MRLIAAKVLAVLTIVVVPASWAGIQAGNSRPSPTLPLATSDTYVPTSGGFPNEPASANLQDILDYIYQCKGCVDAHQDQQPASQWKASTLPAVVAPALAFEFAGTPNIEFGMWAGDSIASLTLAPVFKGSATGMNTDEFNTNATLTWNQAGTKVKVAGDPTSVYNNIIYNIPVSAFGFYIKSESNYWFSDDELNDNKPQMLAYLGGNSATSAGAWTLAFEDGSFSESDKDFNDFVVKIESLAAVPEPATILLLGTAVLTILGVMRSRSRC